MLATQQREIDDLDEFHTFVQLSFEVEDLEHQQIIRVTIQGIYEGLMRCRKTGKWYFLLRDNEERLHCIWTREIAVFIKLGR